MISGVGFGVMVGTWLESNQIRDIICPPSTLYKGYISPQKPQLKAQSDFSRPLSSVKTRMSLVVLRFQAIELHLAASVA
jgi:hypothetical protein